MFISVGEERPDFSAIGYSLCVFVRISFCFISSPLIGLGLAATCDIGPCTP